MGCKLKISESNEFKKKNCFKRLVSKLDHPEHICCDFRKFACLFLAAFLRDVVGILKVSVCNFYGETACNPNRIADDVPLV